jgi:hypothetical protein
MRGQTTLDFATGISIFLFAMLFVFAFIPGVLTPFTTTAQEETVTANRVADLVATDIVTAPGQPYLLDGACTAALLNSSLNSSSALDCGFSGGDMRERLDLAQRQSVNITFRGSPDTGADEILCWDNTSEQVVNASNATACDYTLTGQTGTDPSSGDSVVTARRIVSIDGTKASMEVRIW